MSFCSCKGDSEKAQAILNKAEAMYKQKNYTAAKSLIDSLRDTYPEAIEERKGALRLVQKMELELAQKHIGELSPMMDEADTAYHQASEDVLNAIQRGQGTAELMTRKTRLRIRYDSIKTKFDTECMKVRYIKQKMEEPL